MRHSLNKSASDVILPTVMQRTCEGLSIVGLRQEGGRCLISEHTLMMIENPNLITQNSNSVNVDMQKRAHNSGRRPRARYNSAFFEFVFPYFYPIISSFYQVRPGSLPALLKVKLLISLSTWLNPPIVFLTLIHRVTNHQSSDPTSLPLFLLRCRIHDLQVLVF